MILLLSCRPEPPEEKAKPLTLEQVPPDEVPDFRDDMNADSLRTAIAKSLAFYERIPKDRMFALGDKQISARTLRSSLILFSKLLDTNHLDSATLAKYFDIYRPRDRGSKDRLLVTGYYEPILEGRLEPNESFCYPVYEIPPDLVTIELSDFDPGRYPGTRLVGRVVDKRVVPYFSRAEIDGKRKLERLGCELAWLKDPLDAFFLHVQGSGMIRLPGGESVRIGYAGTNGRPYSSIGKYLIDEGVMSSEEMSLQSLRAYLGSHSEILNQVLWQNESYVFFRWVEDGPMGSLNVALTAGRSIATDPRCYPKGALAFIESEKPRLNSDGQVTRWEPLSRWVLNQDTGGAIKGLGRVDLFCGSGEAAEWIAGRLKHPGRLFFLVKKENAGD